MEAITFLKESLRLAWSSRRRAVWKELRKRLKLKCFLFDKTKNFTYDQSWIFFGRAVMLVFL